MTFCEELLLLCFPLVISRLHVSLAKTIIQVLRIVRWIRTHVSLQEAVLQFAGRVVSNDEEKFLFPLTLTCHEMTIHLGLYNSFYSSAIWCQIGLDVLGRS